MDPAAAWFARAIFFPGDPKGMRYFFDVVGLNHPPFPAWLGREPFGAETEIEVC